MRCWACYLLRLARQASHKSSLAAELPLFINSTVILNITQNLCFGRSHAAVGFKFKVCVAMRCTGPYDVQTTSCLNAEIGATVVLPALAVRGVPPAFDLGRSDSASSSTIEAALQEQKALLNGKPTILYSTCPEVAHQSHGCLQAQIMMQVHLRQIMSAQLHHIKSAQAKDQLSQGPALQHMQANAALPDAKTHAWHRLPCAAQQQPSDTNLRPLLGIPRGYGCVNPHLAALQAQGTLASMAQIVSHMQQNRPPLQRLPVLPSGPAAGVSQKRANQTSKSANKDVRQRRAAQTSKPANTDMFGVATDDVSSIGSGLGLVLLRPASSLW